LLSLPNTAFSAFGGTFNGEAGTDTLTVALTAGSSADLNLTNTFIQNPAFLGAGFNLSGIEGADLIGGSGENRFDASGFTNGPVSLRGEGGNDILIGGGLADSLLGGSGDDVLRGGPGDDTSLGGGGSDILVGADGEDRLNGGTDRDLVIGGTGRDLLDGVSGDDVLISGTVTYEGDDLALRAVLLEWNTANAYDDRVQHLCEGGGSTDRCPERHHRAERCVPDDSRATTARIGTGRTSAVLRCRGHHHPSSLMRG
jgi:Ca2+-binding RTX toxin-like protein